MNEREHRVFGERRVDLSYLRQPESVEFALVHVGSKVLRVADARSKGFVFVPGLTYWRKKKRLTPKRLFELSGIDDVWIDHLEHRDWCRPETVAKLAEALGVEPADLMGQPPEAN
jgi:hypothetical protein